MDSPAAASLETTRTPPLVAIIESSIFTTVPYLYNPARKNARPAIPHLSHHSNRCANLNSAENIYKPEFLNSFHVSVRQALCYCQRRERYRRRMNRASRSASPGRHNQI